MEKGTPMILLELTKAEAIVVANMLRRTSTENPVHWKGDSVEKTRALYNKFLEQTYDYNIWQR